MAEEFLTESAPRQDLRFHPPASFTTATTVTYLALATSFGSLLMDVQFDHSRKFDPQAYQVPNGFPALLEAYVKEVTRFNPDDILDFSTQYFTALGEGKVEVFLDSWREIQPYVPARLQEPEVEHVSQSDRDYYQQTQKISGVNAIPIRRSTQAQEGVQFVIDNHDVDEGGEAASASVSSSDPISSSSSNSQQSQQSSSDMQRLTVDDLSEELKASPRRGSFQGMARVPAMQQAPTPDSQRRKVDIFRKAFQTYDPENSGSMDIAHFAELLGDLGWAASEEELREALQTLDANGDGDIDFQEFLQWSEYSWQSRIDSGAESHPMPDVPRKSSASSRRSSTFVLNIAKTVEETVEEVNEDAATETPRSP
jgi:hypothetical protein